MKEQLVDKMSNLITSAFGLVAALAWNDAIKAIFANYYQKGEGVQAMVIYAVVVTVVAVVATTWIGRAAGKIKELTAEEQKKIQEQKSGND